MIYLKSRLKLWQKHYPSPDDMNTTDQRTKNMRMFIGYTVYDHDG